MSGQGEYPEVNLTDSDIKDSEAPCESPVVFGRE